MSSSHIEELLRRKAAAVEAEDFDEAKRLKQEIERLQAQQRDDDFIGGDVDDVDDDDDDDEPVSASLLPADRRRDAKAPLLAGRVGGGVGGGLSRRGGGGGGGRAAKEPAAPPSPAAQRTAAPPQPAAGGGAARRQRQRELQSVGADAWVPRGPQLHKARGGGRPLIVLLGWAGAEPQALLPVVRWWQGLGCDVLRYTDTMWSPAWPERGAAGHVSLYHNIRRFYMENRGFIVHAHSTLGAYTLGRLMAVDADGHRELFMYCRGVIYDCGPTLQNAEQVDAEGCCPPIGGLTEQAAVLTAAARRRPLTAEVHALWTPFYLVCLILLALWAGRSRRTALRAVWQLLTTALSDDTPVLFLRSDSDDYASAEDISGFRSAVAARCEVQDVVLEGAAHCQTLISAERERVEQALTAFLLKCHDDY